MRMLADRALYDWQPRLQRVLVAVTLALQRVLVVVTLDHIQGD